MNDPDTHRALNAAIDEARQHGRLREYGTLEAFREAIAPFFTPESRPPILETWVHQPGTVYAVAVVTPGPGLEPGDWRAGPVRYGGRDGLAVVLVVDHETARALELWARAPGIEGNGPVRRA